MNRDIDLLRHILFEIESRDEGDHGRVDIDRQSSGDAKRVEHLHQFYELGFIEGNEIRIREFGNFEPRRITARGHDCLDAIRDPEIWQKTKDGATAAGGFTRELLGELAKGLVKTTIKQHTGVEF